ncbi:uncharacterized protein LOC116346487 [Contarinia nasturtii]|uniref:uncharacterized protein LOC116346487 n=1 Tax=Contarinia nasturtii TaxID=265458 RepID=UPI0012D4452E|nr:uncharacterized protein LOC116346487 [Contarinia nasturtii]
MKLFLSFCALITLANAQFGGFGEFFPPFNGFGNGQFGGSEFNGRPARPGFGRPPLPPPSANLTVTDDDQIACIITGLQTLNASNTNFSDYFENLITIQQQQLTNIQNCKTLRFYDGVRCVIHFQAATDKKNREVIRSFSFAGREVVSQIISTFKDCLGITTSTTTEASTTTSTA